MATFNKNRIVLLLKVIIMSLVLAGIISSFIDRNKEKDNYFDEDCYYLYDFAMGTSLSCQIYGDKESAKQLALVFNNGVKDLDEKLISWRAKSSELSLVNAGYTVSQKYEVSQELAEIIKASLMICRDTEGALDITIRPLAELWGIEDKSEKDFEVPDKTQIHKALSDIGYEHVAVWDNSVIIDKSGIIIDLGAVGKGYALDWAKSLVNKSIEKDDNSIKSTDIEGAIISVGGSILVTGQKSDGSDWRIGIRNPKGDIDDMLGYITIEQGKELCVSTSGDYEKYIEKDGVRYHHILDTSTGYPVDTDLASVTVVCENGLASDGLSTACFSLGYERSEEILSKYNAAAVFIYKDNTVKTFGDISFIENK